MSVTFEIRTTSRVWEKRPAGSESNANREIVDAVSLPAAALVDDLLERLIVRSTSPEGFDREILRKLNHDVWGASKD